MMERRVVMIMIVMVLVLALELEGKKLKHKKEYAPHPTPTPTFISPAENFVTFTGPSLCDLDLIFAIIPDFLSEC